MPFVKLDCGILDSTLWPDADARAVFITALLMAEPFELKTPTPQIAVEDLSETGWIVPSGWYGFVPASGTGIVNRACMDRKLGMLGLVRLCSPDQDSRSSGFEGRRMARIDGGYLVLNFIRYRDRDYTAKDRSRRYRERKASLRRDGVHVTRDEPVTSRNVTHAEIRDQSTEVPKVPQAVAAPATLLNGTFNDGTMSGSPRTPTRVGSCHQHARVAIAWLNEKAGKHFRETETNLQLASARLKEPEVTIEGVKRMIERQVQLWSGTKQEEYLRPETLFGKEKFGGYYDQRDQPVIAKGTNPHGTNNSNGGKGIAPAFVNRNIGTYNDGNAQKYRDAGLISGGKNIQRPAVDGDDSNNPPVA